MNPKRTKARNLLIILFLSLVSFIIAKAPLLDKSGDFAFKQLFAFDWFKSKNSLESLRTLDKVLVYITEKYVDQERVVPERMLHGALNKLQEEIPELIISGKSDGPQKIQVGSKSIKIKPEVSRLPQVKSELSKVLKFIKSGMTSNLTDVDLETIAISGILDTLDPHSMLLSPDQFEETKLSTSGRFGGLGIIITINKNGDLVIIAPIDDTPAYRAGLKAGDVITKIEDESTVNMTLTDAVKMMRGEKGKPCNLTIMRNGFTEPKTFKIIRNIIIVTSVESYKLNESVAYVRVKNFQDDTSESLKKHIQSLRSKMKSFKGLILDLRSDPGGLLEESIAVSDLFLTKGTIVSTVGYAKSFKKVQRATRKDTEPNYPMIVLVDAGSASASEIVAGALKNNNRAVVLGRQTFGKGSVQTLYNLPDNWALKLTIAEYLTPGDQSIQSYGIMPDIRTIPVTVDENDMNLFRSERRIREEDLKKHLKQKGRKNEKPKYQTKYLLTKEEEVDQPVPKNPTKEEKLAKIKKDFEVQFASKIIENARFTDRELILKSMGKLMTEAMKSEDEKIRLALAELGIDWSSPAQGPANECQPPKATLLINEGKQALAGKEIAVKTVVENKGRCILYKLWGISESDSSFFNNRELIFGKLDGGETKESLINVKVPKNAQDKLVNMIIKFDEKFGNLPASAEGQFTIIGQNKPSFALNLQVIDDGDWKSKGNGNGLIEKGEKIAVILSVRNIGRGKSEDNLATIRNLSGKGIFLVEGRTKIGELKPGETKDLKFLFSVRDYYEKPDIEIEAAAYDYTFREYLSDKFKFKIHNKAPLPTSAKGKVLIRRDGANVHNSPDKTSPVLARISGSAVLETRKTFPGFYNVRLSRGRDGWIESSMAIKTEAPATKELGKVISYKMLKTPPRIQIAEDQSIPLETKEKSIKVQGTIYDDSFLKDMYVKVNDKKVFYESYDKGGEKLKKGDFSLRLTLENGLNRIMFFARDDEDLYTRDYYFSSRVVPGMKLSVSKARIFKDTY